jgi:transposase InsO family protein
LIIDYTKFGPIWILHAVDHFTKYHWARAFLTKESANVQTFLNEMFENGCQPNFLLSDNGGEFIADDLEELLQIWGVVSKHGLPYHPETQGAVERTHRSLKHGLRAALMQVKQLFLISIMLHLIRNQS